MHIRYWGRAVFTVSALTLQVHLAVAEGRACPAPLPAAPAQLGGTRPLTPEDLVRLRDIGASDGVFPNSGALALSPDGSLLAFQIRQADADTNQICIAMVVMSLRANARPRVIDQGGALLRASYDFRGKAAFPTGVPLPIAPRWSPDGRWVAFLKRVGSTQQVWRAGSTGAGSAQLTHAQEDVEDFRISEDGRSILYWTRPALTQGRRLIDREGLSGYHFDDRYAPMASNRPFVPSPLPQVAWQQAVEGGAAYRVPQAETLKPEEVIGLPIGARDAKRAANGRSVWLEASRMETAAGRVRLFAENSPGRALQCAALTCQDRIGKIWWTDNGKAVRYFRREGWDSETTAIYEWQPGGDAPKRIFSTTDVLADCVVRSDALICLRESATEPRRVVSLDPVSGSSAVVFDPNPEFAALHLGTVQRLRWRNRFGLEAFGDLVLPVGYRKGKRYPLIIVQYESRGFLRGGTGDEYPIQAFANRGYTVLSVNRPRMIGLLSGATSAVEVERRNLIGFAERHSLLSAIEIGIDNLVRRGIVDRQRIGITGLSDGSTTVQFALSNGRSFAAAAIGTGLWSQTYPAMVGPIAAREFAAQGYPGMRQKAVNFWRRFSVVSKAATIRTPILMQLADDSYLGGLESFTALRDARAPVDLFVFPDEYHVKWQPAHRLAIYRRTLDWFDYWLKDTRSQAPDRQLDLVRWDELRRNYARSRITHSASTPTMPPSRQAQGDEPAPRPYRARDRKAPG